jgi:hypothetical protein
MAQLKANGIPGAWFLQISAMGQDLPDPLSAVFCCRYRGKLCQSRS